MLMGIKCVQRIYVVFVFIYYGFRVGGNTVLTSGSCKGLF